MIGIRAIIAGWLAFVAGSWALCPLKCTAQVGTNAIESSAAFFTQIWQTEDGLPHNNIHGVAQAADGFLWVGTRRGLVRFDGTHFVPAWSADGLELADASIWRMFAAENGSVLAAFENGGVAVGKNGDFRSTRSGNAIYSQRAFHLCADKLGSLWTVSLSGQVERISGGVVQSMGTPGTGGAGPPTLVADSDGTVWLASKGTVGYFRGDEFMRVADDLPPPLFIAPARAGGIWLATAERLCRAGRKQAVIEIARMPWATAESNVRDMLEDRSGALWLGTSRKGLIRFGGGRFQAVATSHNNILCLAEDRVGNLWVGTQGGGLNRVRPRQFKVLDTRRGLPNDSVFSFAEDTTGRLWIATQDGGLCYSSNSVITVVGEARNWPPLCLAADPRGGIWIGTQKNGLVRWENGQVKFVTREAGLQIELLNCLLVDRAGRTWAGSMLEGLFCVDADQVKNFTTKDGLSGNGVRSLAEDQHGAIWIGTDEGGLARFNNGTFEKFTHEHWPGDGARALLATVDDAIWIGTVGRGLVRFKHGKFTQVNSAQGLPDDSIQELMLDDAGWLWCGASRGLFRVKLSELNAAADGQIKFVPTFSHARSDGLSEFQFNGEFQPAAFRTLAGRFWFASVKGAVTFQPDALPQNREPPNIVIESVLRNGTPLNPAGESLLEAGVRRLEFKFVAPDFAAPERVRYRYKLEDADVDWGPVSAEALAVYTNVPPGHHRFRVIACSGDGVWNESGASLAFAVAPFFWQTWWFPLVAIAIGVLLLTGAVRWVALRRLQKHVAVLEAEHALEKERGRIAQDIHDELGANLTSIGWLADLGRKHQAQPVAVAGDLDKIAATARQSLSAMDAIVWALNPQNDSSENFANYVAHFANEFFQPTRIRCRLDIPADLPVQPMSTEARHHLFLAVKEALHNVVQHSEATEVWVRLADTANELRISISDNGRGLPVEMTQPGHDGLANIRHRLEALSGTLRLESSHGNGTSLKFSVPWVKLRRR
ncbi:MAG: two-component regulator propeller domain-containing protein [Verrucomicrobiota bacterium]